MKHTKRQPTETLFAMACPGSHTTVERILTGLHRRETRADEREWRR
jgi:hypothetical protein